MELQDVNPWWKDGKVSPELTGRRRKIFDEIVTYVGKRQIVLFTGLRRVGKTTLMYQIIDELLSKGVNPYAIFYLSFDEMKDDLGELVKQYETGILRDAVSNTKVFLRPSSSTFLSCS